MATTSLSLGKHWEDFIKNQVSTGRYGSASEVVRDALRDMESKEIRLLALREALAEGIREADAGEFVENFSIETLISELNNETA